MPYARATSPDITTLDVEIQGELMTLAHLLIRHKSLYFDCARCFVSSPEK